ncbi:MAG: winged helix DNA-binding domain-containing protein [Candidatus Bathyarchaeia archaeon]
METLEKQAVNQYVFHKQHLAKDSRAENVLQVVRDIVGLHATSVSTPYLSLYARMKGFRRERLDEGLYVRRNLIRLESMRGTLFIFPTEFAPIAFQATKPTESKLHRWMQDWGIALSEYQKLSNEIRKVLSDNAKTLPEIKRALPKGIVKTLERRAGKEVYRMTNLNVALHTMMREGIVGSEKTPRTLRITEANRYFLLEKTYPKLNLESVNPEEAKGMLIQRYIQAFGPVTRNDVAWWTGFTQNETGKVLAAMREELVPVKIAGLKESYLMLQADFNQLTRFHPPEEDSLVLLPYEDPYTKGYKVRERLIDKKLEKTAYRGGGVQPTIVLNGEIVGIWNRDIESGRGPVKLHFFQRVGEGLKKEAIQFGRAIGRLMAVGREVDVRLTNL